MSLDRELEKDTRRELDCPEKSAVEWRSLSFRTEESRASSNSGSESVYLRNYPEFPKLHELSSETLMRVDAISEAGLADLDRA